MTKRQFFMGVAMGLMAIGILLLITSGTPVPCLVCWTQLLIALTTCIAAHVFACCVDTFEWFDS